MIDEREHASVVSQLEEARHDLGQSLEREGQLRTELEALRDIVADACKRLGCDAEVGDGDDLIEAVVQLGSNSEIKLDLAKTHVSG